MLGFVPNMKIFCSEDLFWFQSYWNSDILHENFKTTFRKFYGRHTDLVYKFDTSVSHILKGLFTNCDIWLVHTLFRDGCHMWSMKCSLFPEHLISLPLGSSWFHPFIIYTLQNFSVLGLCLRINDSGLLAWISRTALSWTYCNIGPLFHNVL